MALPRTTGGLKGLLLSVAVVMLPACAQNPVTGESDLVLMSEENEIAIGRRNHPDVIKTFGKYDDPALQSYVQAIGDRLVRNSHRSQLIFRFTVLDSAEVNAFALPGGYVYITRGLMAYLNSEAQLAAVLGHEIGHVTARHAVRQHSASTLAGIFGAVLASQVDFSGADSLINTAGTAVLRGYGRRHELEADQLGAIYLAQTGYEPQAMLDVIRLLKNQEVFEKQLAREEDREPRVYHGVFATHPDNDTRLKEVIGRAADLKKTAGGHGKRETFLGKLDGLAFGDGEAEGIRRGRNFYHKPLGFALQFPEGWKVYNLPDRLLARPRNNSAALQILIEDINRRMAPREFMQRRLKLDELRYGEPIQAPVEGYTAIAPMRTPFGRRESRVVVLYYNMRAYIFTGAAQDQDDPYRHDRLFLDTAHSFHPLTAEERVHAEPLRIRLLRTSGTRFADLATDSRIPNHPEAQLRLLNQYYPEGDPPDGRLIKIVE